MEEVLVRGGVVVLPNGLSSLRERPLLNDAATLPPSIDLLGLKGNEHGVLYLPASGDVTVDEIEKLPLRSERADKLPEVEVTEEKKIVIRGKLGEDLTEVLLPSREDCTENSQVPGCENLANGTIVPRYI